MKQTKNNKRYLINNYNNIQNRFKSLLELALNFHTLKKKKIK